MARKRVMSITERLRQLENRAHKGSLNPAGFEALSEACFRVAVLPGQRPADAVRLLRRAIRSDGTNPKHAYFLARIYFAHGDFDRASRWLREAARHCPTSHRIWSHIALLQRELNQRYSGNDAFEPDDLRFRSAEIFRRVLLGDDLLTADLLEFQPRESSKRKQERLAAKADDSDNKSGEGNDTPDANDTPDTSANGTSQPTSRRLTDSGHCRWSGAADLALEAILEGAASDLVCQKARPLLRQAARMAQERRGGTAAFAILGIDWCIAGLPVETVEYLRRTFPRNLDTPSLRLLDFICHCFRISESEVPRALSDALAKDQVSPTLAAVVHHRRLLWQTLDPRTFSKHSAGRRWLVRYRNSKENVNGRAETMAKAISQAAASFATKTRPVLADSAIMSATPPTDWLHAIASVQEAAIKIERIVAAAAAFIAIHPADCTELVRALEKAAERTSTQLDELLVAAFEASPPDGFGSAASHCRRILNRVLYVRPLAARFPLRPADAPAGKELSEIAAWSKEADGIFPKSNTENGTPVEQIEALEAGARKVKAQLDSDLEKLRLELKAKKNGPLSEKAVAECFEAKTRSEEILDRSGTKIREIGELRATGKLHEWTQQEKDSAQQKGQTLPASEVDRLNEAERAWRGVAAVQGSFRRLITLLDLPKLAAAEAAPARGPSEEEHPLSGIPSLEQALSQFAAQVEARCKAALDTFACYTPSQLAEPALGSLVWSIRARQAEALFRLGQKSAARRIWGQMLTEDRLSVPVLKNIAVSVTRGTQVGCELNAWREYAEMLYFQDCIRNSPRPNAPARATFHRNVGSAYAPGCFLEIKREGDLTDTEEAGLVSFLESPLRVRTYVTHKRLEWFNRKLDFASPTLVLGCDRNDPEGTRTLAAGKLLAFADVCCDQLPQRAKEKFRRLSHAHINTAHQNCKNLQNILEDSVHTTERPRQLEWVREIAMLKRQIGDCILKSKELPRRISSPAFFDELLRLDEVPIDLSPSILSSINRDADVLVHYMSGVRDHFLQQFTAFLGEEDGGKSLQSIREGQFSRLTDEWLELPSVRGSMPVIHFLISRLEEALKTKQYEHACKLSILVLRADDRRANVAGLALVKFTNAVEGAQQCLLDQELIAEVTAWIERARGYLASQPPDRDEENPLSEKAINEVIGNLLHALAKLVEAALNEKQYERACQLSIRILRMDDRRANLAGFSLARFLEAAEKAQRCMLHRELAAEVDAWVERARAHLPNHVPDKDEKNPLSEEAISEVSDNLLHVLAKLFLVPHAGVMPEERKGRLEAPLEQLVREHPATRPIRMLKYWEFAADASKNKRRDEVVYWAHRCKLDAEAVLLDPTIAKKYRDNAEQIKAQIQEAGI